MAVPGVATTDGGGAPAAHPRPESRKGVQARPVQPPWSTIEVRRQRRRMGPEVLVWPAAAVGLLAVTLFVGAMTTVLANPRTAGGPSASPPSLTSDGATSEAGAASGRQQAITVDALLSASSASRARLAPGLAQLDQCRNVEGALPLLQRVRDERAGQVERAASLPVDAIDGGGQLKQLLVDVLERSLRADDAYLSWGRALLRQGCGAKLRYWDTAQTEEQRKTAKRQFVQQWNGIAIAYGLPTRSADEI